MSRRFKASKYKNAAPKLSKHEPWARDLTIGSYNCSGSYIKASAAFVAFNTNAGSQLGILPLDADLLSNNAISGSNLPIINAHSDLVTDIDWSPFEDGLLATCSADSTVKIWSITPNNLESLSTLTPECVTSSKQRRVEIVTFNPVADYLLGYSSQNSMTLWDILYNKEIFQDNELHGDTIMSMSWIKTGNLIATCAKDKLVRIVDPRGKQQVVTSATSHDNAKDSRVQWLGDSSYILTTGFDSSRIRQIFVRDTRNFQSPVKTLNFDSSTGILMPLYDADTNMLFIAGRGDSSIAYMEFSDSEPYLTEGFRYNGEQTKGACLLPKRALKVMDTEVNRLIQLTANSIISIPYHVPRKSYVEFHADLFPDTRGTVTSGQASLWMEGFNGAVTKLSLNPKSHTCAPIFKPSLAERKKEEQANISKMIEHEPTDKYKKEIPEPRPRKKSLSSSGSSSDEVTQENTNVVSNRFTPIPTPRPRINNQSGVSVLRTPSSFLAKRHSGSDYPRSISMDESEIGGVLISQQPISSSGGGNENSSNILNNINNNSNNHDADSEIGHANGHGNHESNGVVSAAHENGNEKFQDDTSSTDGAQLSTSDRRKAFESRSFSVPGTAVLQQAAPESGGGSNMNPLRKPRMTVADRLKMFQQNSLATADEEETTTTTSNTNHHHQHHQSSPPVVETKESNDEPTDTIAVKQPTLHTPIVKPERKNLVKQQQTQQQQESNLNSKVQQQSEVTTAPPKATSKRIDTVFGQVSKFRNFKAAPMHKKFHIENLRNISTTCPGESELIQGNTDRVAVPLNTPGGKIAIFELNQPGRQPDGVIPALVHGTKVMDFMWDPFDNQRLAVGTDDGRLWLWRIPLGGLKEQTNTPFWSTAAHGEKVYFVRFHPLTQDCLATGSYDLSIRIWDLALQQDIIILHLPSEQIQIFSFSWSTCGSKFATACKDGKIRVYEPRKETNEPIVTGKGPAGVRGGRVIWVLEGKFLIVAGFDRSSERQVHMYNSSTLESVATVSLDVSPAILVPFYDEDSSILFLSGRGDSTIFAFDVMSYAPHLRQLSHHRCPGAHQGICFLKKNACEVQNVEFARALRLTEVAVEVWNFTVPRVKSEFFQDDLFPPTKVLWEPTMTSREWFAGANDEPYRVSLKPANMKSLVDASGGNGSRIEPEQGAKQAKEVNRTVTSFSQTLSNEEAAKKQKRVEAALREKFNLNFDMGQELLHEVDETDWNE